MCAVTAGASQHIRVTATAAAAAAIRKHTDKIIKSFFFCSAFYLCRLLFRLDIDRHDINWCSVKMEQEIGGKK